MNKNINNLKQKCSWHNVMMSILLVIFNTAVQCCSVISVSCLKTTFLASSYCHINCHVCRRTERSSTGQSLWWTKSSSKSNLICHE